MTTSKPPTPQAISRLLSAAGFERSAFIPGTGRQHWDGTEVRGSRKRSWGFMVNRYGEERVSVSHITGPVTNPDESEKRRVAALRRCHHRGRLPRPACRGASPVPDRHSQGGLNR